VAREFVVREGRERDFERVFGRDGIWSETLKSSPGYVGSTLRMELEFAAGRRYKVFDYWKAHEDFEGFRRHRRQDLERFNLLVAGEGLIDRETLLGSFYQDDSDWDEDTGLISA